MSSAYPSWLERVRLGGRRPATKKRSPATAPPPDSPARSTSELVVARPTQHPRCILRRSPLPSGPPSRRGRAFTGPDSGHGVLDTAISQHGNERRPGRLGTSSAATRPARAPRWSPRRTCSGRSAARQPRSTASRTARLRRSTRLRRRNRRVPRPSARRPVAGHRMLPRRPPPPFRNTSSSWRDRCRSNTRRGSEWGHDSDSP